MAANESTTRTALWDVECEDGSTFVVAQNGKAKAEDRAAAHLAEQGKPTVKFKLTFAGSSDRPEGIHAPQAQGTLADDLLSGMDDKPSAAPAVKREVKPDPKPAAKRGRGKAKGATGSTPPEQGQASPKAKAAVAKARAAKAAPKAAPKAAAKKAGPTVSERMESHADEARDLWNGLDVKDGMTARDARLAVCEAMEKAHPKEGKLFRGRIPAILALRQIDARNLPKAAK